MTSDKILLAVLQQKMAPDHDIGLFYVLWKLMDPVSPAMEEDPAESTWTWRLIDKDASPTTPSFGHVPETTWTAK